MQHLIAQINPNATDPATWSAAIERNGFGIIVAAVMLGSFVIGGGYIIYRTFSANGFVERLFTRLDVFLTSLDKSLGLTQEALEKQGQRCDMMEKVHTTGPCNPNDLRLAGHHFADMGARIGQQVGVDVSVQRDKIHEVLRGQLG